MAPVATRRYYARIAKDGRKQLLVRHLMSVRNLASRFADEAADASWLQAAAGWGGLIHDLGKYGDPFQDMLIGDRPSCKETQHAVFGAAWAAKHLTYLIAAPVQGHHTGMFDLPEAGVRLKDRTIDAMAKCEDMMARLVQDLSEIGLGLPDRLTEVLRADTDGISGTPEQEFQGRFLLSCIVDADRLDSERFETGVLREHHSLDAREGLMNLGRYLSQKRRSSAESELNRMRRAVSIACARAARLVPGFFSLTAPTGAGKTLAGLRFALRHCHVHRHAHGHRRIIAVLPFLAIIDQNAGVYREVLGDNQVIEHHSSVEVTERSTDNWGAPMIVTTAVQFLETLFSCRPGRVRKLHSIARSVIVLGEVQSMPHQLLEPTLSLLRLLVRDYGCTVVLSSATVSRFGKCRSLPSGFVDGEVREIIPDVNGLFRSLKRVRFELPFTKGEKWSWDRLAEEVRKHPRALVILNTRKQAQQVFRLLRGLGVDALHLSTTMHSVHRKRTIAEANRRLKAGERVVLVSTQCIEAGVDIDFPVVFRAMAPLDAIIQSVERCNREGKLTEGLVVVFDPEDESTPLGLYSESTRRTRGMLARLDDPARMAVDHTLFPDHHQRLINQFQCDERGIQAMRKRLDYRSVDQAYRIIADDGIGVVIPDVAIEGLIGRVRAVGAISTEDLRGLQRFMVNVREKDPPLRDTEPILPESELRLFVGKYDENLGVCLTDRDGSFRVAGNS
jgi:CRISPR-associated endonuclease/helicase Cas3